MGRLLSDEEIERRLEAYPIGPFTLRRVIKEMITAQRDLTAAAVNEEWVEGIYELISKYETDEEFLVIPVESLVAFAKNQGGNLDVKRASKESGVSKKTEPCVLDPRRVNKADIRAYNKFTRGDV